MSKENEEWAVVRFAHRYDITWDKSFCSRFDEKCKLLPCQMFQLSRIVCKIRPYCDMDLLLLEKDTSYVTFWKTSEQRLLNLADLTWRKLKWRLLKFEFIQTYVTSSHNEQGNTNPVYSLDLEKKSTKLEPCEWFEIKSD